MTRIHRPSLLTALTALVLTTSSVPATAEPGVDHAHVPSGQRFHTAGATEAAGRAAVFDAGVTQANGTRTRRIVLGHDTQPAGGGRVRESVDGGATWRDLAPADGVANLFRLPTATGEIVTIDARDRGVTDPSCTDLPTCRRTFDRRALTATGWADAGVATVTFSAPVTSARFGQSPLVLGDGKTLLAGVHGTYEGATPFAVVVKSTDEGRTWTEVAQLATGAGWAEPHLAPTSDGGLLAVLRKDENPRGDVPANVALYTVKAPARTGAGWGAPTRLSGETGNSPTVRLLGNGVLVLASGRPDNVVRFSFDGKGTTWSQPSIVYQNYPRRGGGADGWYAPPGALPRPLRHLGSSGTVGVMPLGGNRLLAVGDNCAAGWGCPTDATVTGYDVDNRNALWKSWLEADTDQWGKVDLTTLFQRGELTVVSPALARYGNCPTDVTLCRQSLAAYAFDGDTRADASLVTTTRSVTLRLPRPMRITGVGLHVYLQGGTDVRIETSADGQTWNIPTRGARDGVLRPFVTPVTTQYLRITDRNAVTDPTAGFIDELELYTSAVGFEHDYPGQAPRGNGWQSTSTLATVVEQTTVPAADRISSRFLRIKDDSPAVHGKATWAHTASTTVTAEFRVRSNASAPKGLLFTLKGKNGSAAATPYGFWLNSGGMLHWATYGQQSPWGTPLNTTALQLGAWHTVRLVANLTQVQVYVDGALVATKPKSQAATSFDGLELASNGTATVGDDWLLDDVTYY